MLHEFVVDTTDADVDLSVVNMRFTSYDTITHEPERARMSSKVKRSLLLTATTQMPRFHMLNDV
ncbi:hypothetical protein KIN20_017467 [Parelaphostrongylus tenuis]|uniref:Uncharacterized protein n=1 Tax=Parelaphostrongylus tenuis TaxID=148309 RepID=A0AAD5QTT8_PARTN|nr:hypothetical protein KIN20_017467 [Parelaphostrongylus tenuis]